MSFSPIFDTFSAAYRSTLKHILTVGDEVSPRGMKTLEIPGFQFILSNSRNNLIVSPTRRMSHKYAIAEWLWIMFGRNDVKTILPHNKNLAPFSDDGRTFAGAYGPRILDQWSYALKSLKDPGSRQAIIQIWRERPGSSKDIPCTLSFQFLVRDEQLHMITNMRSNDAWLGLPYDVFTFTQLQAVMAMQLGIQCGWYQHHVGSMHLYEKHYDLALLAVGDIDRAMAVDPAALYRMTTSPELTYVPDNLESVFIEASAKLPEEFVAIWALDHKDRTWHDYVNTMLDRPKGQFADIRGFEKRLEVL